MFVKPQNVFLFLILLLKTTSKQNSPAEIWDRLQSDSETTHGIKYPFESYHLRYMWELSGNAMFLNNKISLTSNEKGQKGGIWSLIPNHANYWAVHMEFKIHNDKGELFGDGMAFWYVGNISQAGNAFGNAQLFYGLGVFFDTFNNRGDSTEYPFVSASVDNLTNPYDHLTDGITTAIGGCANNFRHPRMASHALIIYLDNKLSVYIKDEKSSKYTSEGLIECFTVDQVFLPGGLHFGVTAATGDLTDYHELMSLRIIELDDDEDLDRVDYFNIVPHVAASSVSVGLDSKDKVTRGFSIALIVLVLIAAMIGLIVYLVSGGSRRDKLF